MCRVYVQQVVFPRIAIKSQHGAVIVRETEKVVDEKVTLRTEEVPCPITGVPHLRTVEVVEKVIETEVSPNNIQPRIKFHFSLV